ncbi:MAG TPA: LPS export ABC transporter ATP-binding protein [Gemmatimonadaceae bacterium]|jgi:lipopolysaccharide export system ATP-binding protein|nr:LPS export ABC transporter ATP-binding protein [Gemmatimonadaceae bacterium]
MTIPDRLFAFAKADRTTAGVLAALIEAADTDGRVRLNDLAIRVRDQYLAQLRQEGRDAEQEAGRLSLDEVRGFLLASVLPRMADEGLVIPPPAGTTDPDALIAIAPAVWSGVAVVGGDREKRSSLAEAIRESGGHAVHPHVPEPEAGTGSTLEAEGLVKVYRRRKVVNDVAVRLRQGEIVGMLGPNGAGKTTTFYMIVGLIQPLTGRILLDGEDITQMPMYRRARQGIGYLSQEPSIFRKLTVEQNILAILEMLPLSGSERRARLEQLLDELSIKHLRHNKAYSLSGGERRRLEITRALVTSPKFMMLDEPFAGVDPIAVHDIQTIVAGLRHRGIGVLISDHNVEQTLDIVDRAYIMFDGQVKVSGTVRQLVFDETVAEIYLGPTLTARLRARYSAA